MPFIDSKHKREDVLFWPDLASCHYARQTQELLEREGIPFVPKEQTPPPPCCPQLRPIEDVWAILRAKTYEGGWEATSELQLKRRIRQSIKALNQEVLKTMMGGGATARAQGCTCRGTPVCALSGLVTSGCPSSCSANIMVE